MATSQACPRGQAGPQSWGAVRKTSNVGRGRGDVVASPSPCRVGVQRLTQPGPGVQTEGWGFARGLACLLLSRSTQPSARRPAWLRRGRSRSSRGHRPQRSPLGGRRPVTTRGAVGGARGAGGGRACAVRPRGRGDRGPAPWRLTPHPVPRRAGRAESLQRTPSPQEGESAQ